MPCVCVCVCVCVLQVIYIARNAKDVAVSYYFFARMFSESSYAGTMEDFAESFLAGQGWQN